MMHRPPTPPASGGFVAALCVLAIASSGAGSCQPKIAVAVNHEDGSGSLSVVDLPRRTVRLGVAPLGPQAVMRGFEKSAFAVSATDGTVRVIHAGTGATLHHFDLGAATSPQDVAVVSATRAYVSTASSGRLLRLDLATGAVEPSVDLTPLADADGNPDLGMMEIDDSRLLVQVRRFNDAAPEAFARPAQIAVVDLTREELIDVDPALPGVQGIALTGTWPKMKMQVMRVPHRLFVSATGAFFDAGGIERIDLDTLSSEGLVIAEADDQTGADLGAFVMVAPDRGFLTFSTDLLLSSHLKLFTLPGGVEPGLELHVTLDYFVPTILHRGGRIFVPDGGFGRDALFVFDALTGDPAGEPIDVGGQPSDVALMSF